MGALGNTLDPTNHDSPIGALAEPIQKYTDPLSWITGGKWADLTSKDMPRWTNEALSPITQGLGQIDKSINPLRRIPMFDRIGDVAEAKPGDTIGLVVGSIFSGGALDGAMAGAGGGTAGAVGAGAADMGAAGSAAGAAAGGGIEAGAGLGGIGAGTGIGASSGIGAGAAADAGLTGAGAGAFGVGSAYGLGGAGALGGASVGMTGVGNGIGSNIGAGAGQSGTGFYGGLNGAAAYGDSGLTGTIGTSAGSFSMPADAGGALGDAPTGLFSGSLPGGGMTGTSSGAMGGGLSGGVNGAAPIGYGSSASQTMGGLINNPNLVQAQNLFSAAQKANTATNLAKAAQANSKVGTGPASAPPAARKAVNHGSQTPQPLPSMANPQAGFAAMPTMGTALPTSTSSYDALLHNMLANTSNGPTAGLVGAGGSGTFMPGAGGPMNPGYIIPGMY